MSGVPTITSFQEWAILGGQGFPASGSRNREGHRGNLKVRAKQKVVAAQLG